MATHHESITIRSFSHSPHSWGVNVALETETVFPSRNPETNNAVLLDKVQVQLQSILDTFHLESFTLSISQSSDNSVTLGDIELNNVDANRNSRINNINPFTKSFPVGTSIRYNTNSGHGETHDETHDHHDHDRTSSTSIDENNLIHSLSRSGLLCQNVQMSDVLKSIPLKEGHSHINSSIIIIPNDAYSLCHTKTLHEMIVSASPCRDKYGIYSKLELESLNSLNVYKKAIWLKVGREDKRNKMISIQWGIRYHKRLFTRNISLMDIMSNDSSLSGNYYEYENNRLQSCPMTKSSTLTTQNSKSKWDIINLHEHQIAMNSEILNINRESDEGKYQVDSTMGIERQILRRNGVTHYGTFQSRIFHSDIPISTCENGMTNVDVMEYYPKVVKPLFHTLKVFMVQENENGGTHNTTQLNLSQINQYIDLSPDGSSTMSFSTNIPSKSTLNIQIDYEPMFLSFELFPADPNRGFDILPSYASFTITCPTATKHIEFEPITIYSNSLLLMPPVPDMSMPFNVISLCGTCLAILVGTTINLLVKKSSESVNDALKGVKTKSPLHALKDKLLLKMSEFKGNSTSKTKKVKTH